MSPSSKVSFQIVKLILAIIRDQKKDDYFTAVQDEINQLKLVDLHADHFLTLLDCQHKVIFRSIVDGIVSDEALSLYIDKKSMPMFCLRWHDSVLSDGAVVLSTSNLPLIIKYIEEHIVLRVD